MGINISIQKCSVCELYNELYEKYGEFTEYNDFKENLEKFGEVHIDTFFVLENEYHEDCNSFVNVFKYLDEKYLLDNSFSVAIPLFEECVGNVSLDYVDCD